MSGVFDLLPKADQKVLAALVQKWGRDTIRQAVDGAYTKRGRPRKLPLRDLPGPICLTVDMLAEDIADRGCLAEHGNCTTPWECALRQAAALDHVSLPTMLRKYRKDRRDLAVLQKKR